MASTMKRTIVIIVAVGAFGVLMSLRPDIQPSGQRAAIAALAFCVLGLLIHVLLWARQRS
jgi:hypothetical protein